MTLLAREVGIDLQFVSAPLKVILTSQLPAIVFLKEGPCVLIAQAADYVTVRREETAELTQRLSIEVLAACYTGQAVFVNKRPPSPAARLKGRAWVWQAIGTTKGLYAEVLLASFFINLFSIASSLFVMNVYDRVVPNQALATLAVLSLGIFIVYSFDFLMKTLRGYFIDHAAKKIDKILSTYLFKKILNIKMAARPASMSTLTNQLHQFDVFRDFLTSTVISTLIDLPFALLCLGMMYHLGKTVILAPLVALPVVILVGLGVQLSLRQGVKDLHQAAGQKQRVLIEALNGIETLKSLGLGRLFQEKWAQSVEKVGKLGATIRALTFNMVNFAAFAQQVASLGVIMIGVHRIADGNMSMGALIACTVLSNRALAPLSQLAHLLTRYHQARAALEGVERLVKMPQERQAGSVSLPQGVLKGEVVFQQVSFSYAHRPHPVLESITLRIAAGEKVGILGRMGSGKTTFEKLIVGLYQATKGYVLLDGMNIDSLNQPDLLKNIGYVPQEIMLFEGSVKENIAMGASYLQESAILRAAQIAGVIEFTQTHPLGWHMPVGEKGAQLSGGQRQAIAIARALVRDPSLLLLDEPTNMMDNQAEALFTERLQAGLTGKTLILVTHKAALLSLVDRLILLDAGKVVADGPKEHVLQALAGGKLFSYA